MHTFELERVTGVVEFIMGCEFLKQLKELLMNRILSPDSVYDWRKMSPLWYLAVLLGLTSFFFVNSYKVNPTLTKFSVLLTLSSTINSARMASTSQPPPIRNEI